MRKDNITLLGLFLLAIIAFTLFPANAFIYPDDSVDSKYENFGPRLDRLQVVMYDGLDAMWTGLANGEIDIADWPLTTSWLTTFTTPPYNETVQVTSYGGDAEFYVVDFNLNNNYWLGNPPGGTPLNPLNPATGYPYPNPVSQGPGNATQNVCSNLNFRRGVNYLFNRTWYQEVIAGWGIMIYTPVPSYLGSLDPGEGLINQNIRPGGALEALTYPNDEAAADAEFALAKVKIVAGQNGDKRFWDRDDDNVCDAGEEIIINFNSRQDTGRAKAAEWLTARLEAHGFVMDTQYITGGQNYQETILDKNYHITTFGWINIDPGPDYLFDIYHETGYWHDPESPCPNTQFLNDPTVNYWAERIKFNLTGEGARLSAWKFQEAFATTAAQIPLFSPDGYKAHSRTYVGGTPEEAAYAGSKWESLCEEMGFGDNSWHSFENAYPQGFDFGAGNKTIRYGWSETGYPKYLNPLYAGWYRDVEVASKIYDTLGHRDPYALSTWQPYLIENWTVGTWRDPSDGIKKSKVTITLRPDLKWADGVPITVDDVVYSFTEVSYDLVWSGYPPPWSWAITSVVTDARILDPYNVEILFSVESFLVESWTLGGTYIIPKHIWRPIIASGDPTAFAPDPNLIGSGPWRYVSMTPGASLLMVANKPDSTVTTDRLGATAITSPGTFNYYPVDIQTYETSYLTKFYPSSDLTFKVKLNNMWTGTSLIVDKYVTIRKTYPLTIPNKDLNGALGEQITTSTLGITLAPNTPHEELFFVDNAYAGNIQINVTIVYQTAPFVGLARTVIVDQWITLPEDIGGAYLTGSNPPYPVPDSKVDGKDLAIVSKAFGTRPGMTRWSPLTNIWDALVYVIDGKTLARMAKKFGWHA